MRSYDSEKICKWIDSEDFYYKRFCFYADLLEDYLTERILMSQINAKSIARNLEKVLMNCDNVNFDDLGAMEAYLIWHFLPRILRYQVTFHSLLKSDILPIRKNKIEILELGAGPAQALFVISDIYNLLKIYRKKDKIKLLENIDFHLDYVERSISFRSFIHNFIEQIIVKNKNNTGFEFTSKVPFSGTYKDVKELLDFRRKRMMAISELKREREKWTDFDYWENIDESKWYVVDRYNPEEREKYHKELIASIKNSFRYSLVVGCYFFTYELKSYINNYFMVRRVEK